MKEFYVAYMIKREEGVSYHDMEMYLVDSTPDDVKNYIRRMLDNWNADIILLSVIPLIDGEI